MFPVVKWYHKIGEGHLARAVRHEDIRLVAVSPSDSFPYLCLTWIINNGSETQIEIKRLCGSIYMGNSRIATFDVQKPFVKNTMAGNRQQYFTVQRKVLGKGDKSGVEFNFYPAIDWWLAATPNNNYLLDGNFEVYGYGVDVTIPLIKDNLNIEGIAQSIIRYYDILRSRLDSILKGV